MNATKTLFPLLLLISILAYVPNASVVGTASMRAPAVLLENYTSRISMGSLTKISVVVSDGTGGVSISGAAVIANSTLDSAVTAAKYAAEYSGVDPNKYNFAYSIDSPNENVSGPSAGAAMTLLAISSLQHRPLRTDFTITGTISEGGAVGEIGGVYDKANISVADGLDLILVPRVPQGSYENLMYAFTQASLSIPLVQVSNISDAAAYAFNGSKSGPVGATQYDPYTDYSVAQLPSASLACTSACNSGTFGKLVNATFNITAQEISAVGSKQSFSGIAAQMYKVLNQSRAIAGKGYLYVGADFSFLDYIDAYYFSSHGITSNAAAIRTLKELQSSCSALTPPQLTSDNYGYVVGAEMRQSWGNYTVSAALSAYNTTALDSDTVLSTMYQAGQASGWCSAASTVYSAESNYTGYAVQESGALASVAQSRMDRASQYGNSMYYVTARQAYSRGDYALAMLDADYAFALSNATAAFSSNTSDLISSATRLAENSTYGVWATEYANEAMFYIHESMAASNQTAAHLFATQAYSSALLAQQISNDTQIIGSNLQPSSSSGNTLAILNQMGKLEKTIAAAQNAETTQIASYINYSERLITATLVLAVSILALDLALMAFLLRKLRSQPQQTVAQGRGRKQTR